jgi:hypothetical protein
VAAIGCGGVLSCLVIIGIVGNMIDAHRQSLRNERWQKESKDQEAKSLREFKERVQRSLTLFDTNKETAADTFYSAMTEGRVPNRNDRLGEMLLGMTQEQQEKIHVLQEMMKPRIAETEERFKQWKQDVDANLARAHKSLEPFRDPGAHGSTAATGGGGGGGFSTSRSSLGGKASPGTSSGGGRVADSHGMTCMELAERVARLCGNSDVGVAFEPQKPGYDTSYMFYGGMVARARIISAIGEPELSYKVGDLGNEEWIYQCKDGGVCLELSWVRPGYFIIPMAHSRSR